MHADFLCRCLQYFLVVVSDAVWECAWQTLCSPGLLAAVLSVSCCPFLVFFRLQFVWPTYGVFSQPSLVFPGAVVYVNALLITDFMINKHPYIRFVTALLWRCLACVRLRAQQASIW